MSLKMASDCDSSALNECDGSLHVDCKEAQVSIRINRAVVASL